MIPFVQHGYTIAYDVPTCDATKVAKIARDLANYLGDRGQREVYIRDCPGYDPNFAMGPERPDISSPSSARKLVT